MFIKWWNKLNHPQFHYNCDWIMGIPEQSWDSMSLPQNLNYGSDIGHLNWKATSYLWCCTEKACVRKEKGKEQREEESRRERKKQLWVLKFFWSWFKSHIYKVRIHDVPLGYRRYPFVFLLLSSYLFKLVWLVSVTFKKRVSHKERH